MAAEIRKQAALMAFAVICAAAVVVLLATM
jgi:hypothetical protein